MIEVTHEIVGETQWGGPHVLVTVAEGHPKAGFQLLLKSCAGMPPIRDDELKPGEERYLAYEYPEERHSRGWHGAVHATSVEAAVAQVADYMEWLFEREEVRERILWDDGFTECLDRFRRALWENGALDYKQEWRKFLDEVARIQMIMATVIKEEEK